MKNLIFFFGITLMLFQNISAQQNFVIYEPDEINVKSPNSNSLFAKENLIEKVSLGKRWLSERNTNISSSNVEWIHYSYHKETVIDSLYLFSANTDIRSTDPKVFKVEAKNDATTWETLYTSDNTVKFDVKGQQKKFFLNNNKAFKHYRIVIQETKDINQKNASLSRVVLIGKYALAEKDLKLEIYQIKVSEGNSTLIVVKNKRYNTVISSTIVDAGKTVADGTLIAEVIKEKSNAILNNAFITHYHDDHYGGFNSKGGLLNLRCKKDNGFPSSIVPDNETDLVNKLQLYGVKDDNHNEVPQKFKSNFIDEYVDAETLVFNDWSRNTDLNLEPTKNIKLVTLAINSVLKDGLIRNIKVKDKNNRSGVLLIVWGDFSFLIQGDMQAAGSGDKIARTSEYYRPDISNTVVKTPSNWDAINDDEQLARDLPKNAEPHLGISRLNLSAMHKPGLPLPAPLSLTEINDISNNRKKNQALNMYTNRFYIAYPNLWLHELGKKIDLYNGLGKYAHACVSLIPHHGGMTSNLWFDTKYGIISNNATGNHGHPNPQAVEAVYHTAGVSNLYFTYLEDNKVYHSKTLNRLTELTDWRNNYVLANPGLENVNFHVLNTNQTYFKIEVEADQNDQMKKKFKINKGEGSSSSFIECPSH